MYNYLGFKIMRYLLPTLLVLSLSCLKTTGNLHKQIFYRMDTVVEVTLVLRKGDAKRVGETWRAIDSFLEQWETRYSQTNPRSEILALNRDTSRTRHVSRELAKMLHTALRMGDTCGGMFDITVLPLKRLWGLGEEDTGSVHTRPDSAVISKALAHVNYRSLRIDTQNALVVYDDPAVMIDAGGIAKGFALMRIADMLDSLGFTDFLVNGGGDVIGRGHRRDGTSWRIAIKHPRVSDQLLGAFRLDSGNVFTSGDYERFWLDPAGERVHHIFNPKTGYSATANQSVTIWSMDPVVCKFYSTGLFGLPADSIIAFVKQRPGVECLVVDSLGDILISEGWHAKIELYEKN